MIAMDNEREKLIGLLNEHGVQFRGNSCRCIFHDDKHASAGVYQGKDGRWRLKCHVCDISWDVYDLESRLTGKPLSECLPRTEGQPKRTTESKPVKVFKTLDDLKRTLPGRVVDGYVYDDGMKVFRCETPSGKVFRPSHETPGGWTYGATEKPWPLYRLERLKDASEVYVVEGEKCVHAIESLGLSATTSAFGAKSPESTDWSPLAGKKIVLWPDCDDNGRDYTKKVKGILERLTPRPEIFTIEPNDLGLELKQDVVDFCEMNGRGDDEVRMIRRVIRKCRPSAGLRELLEQTIAGRRQAISTPWRLLDVTTLALQAESVLMLCGGVGASKSFMMLQCCQHWMETGVPFSLYELEESREFHELRVLAQRSGIADLTNPEWVKEHPDEVRQAYADNADFMDSFVPNLYATPERQPTLQDLASWVDEQAKQGKRIVALDPITAGLHMMKNSWEEDSEFLQRIKKTATRYLCSVVLITHPVKPSNGEPDLSLIAGSAAYTRFSQTVIWLQNHDQKQSTIVTDCGPADILHNRTLHILKARYGKGQGMKIACSFTNRLELKIEGVIVKEK